MALYINAARAKTLQYQARPSSSRKYALERPRSETHRPARRELAGSQYKCAANGNRRDISSGHENAKPVRMPKPAKGHGNILEKQSKSSTFLNNAHHQYISVFDEAAKSSTAGEINICGRNDAAVGDAAARLRHCGGLIKCQRLLSLTHSLYV